MFEKLRNPLINFFYSHFFIASSAFFATLFSMSINRANFQINSSLEIPFLNFFGILFVYNYQSILKKIKKYPIHSQQYENWLNKNIVYILIIVMISFFSALIIYFKLSYDKKIILLFTATLSLIYILPKGLKNELRSVAFLKIFLIAFTWAVTTAFVPLQNDFNSFTKFNVIHFLQYFIYYAAISIPFDVRDIKKDNNLILTFPNVFGVKKSILLSQCLLIFSIFILLYKNFIFKIPSNIIFAEFIALLFALSIITFNKKKNDYTVLCFLLDTTILFPFFLMHIFNLIV